MTFPVYIASRARWNTCSTARLLSRSGVPFTLVVEPHESALYRAAFPDARITTLIAGGQGLAFARNAVLDMARHAGHRWFWILDDDITRFARTSAVRNRLVPCPAALVLETASLMLAELDDTAIAALSPSFEFAANPRPITYNRACDSAVAIHAGRAGHLRYRPEMGVKVDREFTLQVLATSWQAARITGFVYLTPANGSNKGGLWEAYATEGAEAADCRRLVAKWPAVCQCVVKPNGRHDVKIDWKAAAAMAAH